MLSLQEDEAREVVKKQRDRPSHAKEDHVDVQIAALCRSSS